MMAPITKGCRREPVTTVLAIAVPALRIAAVAIVVAAVVLAVEAAALMAALLGAMAGAAAILDFLKLCLGGLAERHGQAMFAAAVVAVAPRLVTVTAAAQKMARARFHSAFLFLTRILVVTASQTAVRHMNPG